MNCGECGDEIKNYHPHANYQRVTMSTNEKEVKSGYEEKKLCQKCATAVAKEFNKYKAGGLYIE